MATPLLAFADQIQPRQAVQTGDKNVGSAQKDDTPSLSGLIATLVPVLLIAGIMLTLFLLLRNRLRRNYAPRTYLGSLREQERSPDLPSGLFNWISTFMTIPDTYVLNHQSLDAYLLLRYLKIATTITFVGCLITWPVLFPVNITSHGQQQQLNLLSMSNISEKNRYYAHTGVAWIFFGFLFYMIARESIFYINLRQAYLLSPLYANRMSSRTVLFTSVPEDFLNEAKLRRTFGKQVKNLWIATDCEKLQELVEERDKVAFKLEAAETKLIKLAGKARLKSIKKGIVVDERVRGDEEGESGSVASEWVEPKARPTHRLKFLIGKKVDTINWCRSELERLIPEVEALQATYRAHEGKLICSVFIEFYTQTEAQAAYQSLAHHEALHMAPRFIGVDPETVIWENLNINWASRVIRNIVTLTLVTLLIIFWSIPVGFVGIISNIRSLVEKAPWLEFLYKIPPVIFGVIQGLLPAVLLSVLMALLPIILRLMAKKSGAPSRAAIELRTQNFYFAFQVIQVFLVTTVTSAASAVGAQIAKQPSQATSLLASNLPHAANFFLSYIIVQGLTLSSAALAQIAAVVIFRLLGKFLDNTPRKMYKRYSTLKSLGWGTVFPIYTNLIVIALSYSIIAPLVLGFATVGLYLMYVANRYNLLFVFNSNIDTKGLVYPRALQQTTVGAYISILCLIGLFGIKAAIGPLILMIVLLIVVILFHVSLNAAIEPLLNYLPKSLQAEEDSLLALEDAYSAEEGPPKNGTQIATAVQSHETDNSPTSTGKGLPPAPHKKPNLIAKWLKPDKFTDYHTLRRLVPRGFADIGYDPIVERDAYYNPAIASPTPLLWIPRDLMGISRQECRHSSKVIPMSDDDAGFDEKNNLVWNEDKGRPPIWKEKIYY